MVRRAKSARGYGDRVSGQSKKRQRLNRAAFESLEERRLLSALTPSATATSPSSVDVSWTDTNSATGYDITYTANDGSSGEITPDKIDQSGSGSHDFVLTGLFGGRHYDITVTGTYDGDSSDPGDTEADTPEPWAPLLISAAAGAHAVQLTWNNTGGDYYQINRSLDGATWASLADISRGSKGDSVDDGIGIFSVDSSGNLNYTDRGLDPDTVYWYQVRALDMGMGPYPSAWAETSVATDTVAASLPIDPPSTVSRPDQISLSWIDPSYTASDTTISVSTDGVNFTELAQLSAGVDQYLATDLVPDQPYTFQITSDYSYGMDGGTVNGSSTGTTNYSYSYSRTATGQSLIVHEDGNSSWSEGGNY